ncbi:LacI family DNA-binding transcriptional regulator [Burkholderiaceae bacterium DAT-1]|nr:LacI family DNA-binding transcriptional regulator [Burkholderiaceae bacterium DAT-1]
MKRSPPPDKKSGRTQMVDLARMAGVSVSTVSRALANSSQIGLETRERIQALAASLHYTVNVGAQNLRRNENRTIAVVIPFDAVSHQNISDPFFLRMLGALADALTQRGYHVLVSRVNVQEVESIANLYFGGVAAGIVLIGQWGLHDQLNRLATLDVPIVIWGAQVQQQLYCSVGGDNVEGGRLATAHLIEQGCKRILFVGNPPMQEVGDRYRGYQQALKDAGMADDPDRLMPLPFEPVMAAAALQARLDRGLDFDGIFACSDVLAVTFMRVLHKAGYRVPEDVRVVGYDDVDWATFAQPSLTTIHQPIEVAAQAMVERLLLQIQGERTPPLVLPVQLVQRESSIV